MKIKMGRTQETEKKTVRLEKHTSLVSRISSFYTKMFASWISTSMVIIFLLVIIFNVLFLYYNTQPHLDRIGTPTDENELARTVTDTLGTRLILLDDEDNIVAVSFEEAKRIEDPILYGFYRFENRIYYNYTKEYSVADGQDYSLIMCFDITLVLLELAVIAGAGIILFFISVVTIYLRGNYLTRKAFGVIDEMIIKAENISSQNLNLRLNVSDSTDELVDFALTFNNMMDRIEKAYEKQKQFVSDASHELRTPIAVIQGYARMLERWGKDDKDILQESIDAVSKESKNMQDLVDKLLFIARNDKDTLVFVKNKFNMSDLVQELDRDTRMLEKKQHKIISNIKPDIVVDGDRDQIKQTLRILVDNALKYTEPGGAVTINLDSIDNYAVTMVSDTGVGIKENELSSIFDRFYRVDTAREREKGGHGLGLSIARIIVLRHGGKIKVASKPGNGTRFSVYLPLLSS